MPRVTASLMFVGAEMEELDPSAACCHRVQILESSQTLLTVLKRESVRCARRHAPFCLACASALWTARPLVAWLSPCCREQVPDSHTW